ncbi:MAG: hypothetical protein R6V55_00475 [Desulfovermiculus sp.]
MEYRISANHLQAAGPARTVAQAKPGEPGLWEKAAVCVCPNCLEHFTKNPGQACVDCRCPVCNVPLRNK